MLSRNAALHRDVHHTPIGQRLLQARRNWHLVALQVNESHQWPGTQLGVRASNHAECDAFRSLAATPVLSAVAILSLALGIGANTAIFSILDSLILRTLPVKEPQRLVMIDRGSWTNPIWEAIRDRQPPFDGATAWSPTRFNLAAGGQTDLVDGVWASGRFFDVLGTPAMLGRTFAPDDDRRGET